MKKILALFLSLVFIFVLVSCSSKNSKYSEYPDNIAEIMQAMDSNGKSVESIRELIEAFKADQNGDNKEKIISLYQDLYAMDGFSDKDYSDFADLYISCDEIAKAVDLLEKQYRISTDPGILKKLSDLVIDIEGSDGGFEGIKDLYALIDSGDYGSAVRKILSEEWFEAFRPKTLLNFRNYRYRTDADSELLVSVGFDQYYQHSVNALMVNPNGADVSLQCSDSVISVIECEVTDGQYNGDYVLTQLNVDSGTAFVDKGSFSDNVLVGEYESRSCWNIETEDPADTFAEIDNLTDDHYYGSFDESGHALAEQRSDDPDSSIIFAYNEDDTYYMNIVPEQNVSSDEYVFGIDVFRIAPALCFAD